jgi:hypothetical protein
MIWFLPISLYITCLFRLNVKTVEESDLSGTDPEDESQSMADIGNMKVYQEIFQPSRIRMYKLYLHA